MKQYRCLLKNIPKWCGCIRGRVLGVEVRENAKCRLIDHLLPSEPSLFTVFNVFPWGIFRNSHIVSVGNFDFMCLKFSDCQSAQQQTRSLDNPGPLFLPSPLTFPSFYSTSVCSQSRDLASWRPVHRVMGTPGLHIHSFLISFLNRLKL